MSVPLRTSSLAAILAGLSLCAPARAQQAPASAADLLARARTVRARAEAELAQARKQILAERKALAAELQKAYADLDAATARARTEADTLRRLHEAASDAQKSAGRIGDRTQRVLARAAELAGVEVDEKVTAADLSRRLWAGLQERLAALERQTRLTLMHEPVITRDGKTQRLPVLRLGAFAGYACGSGSDTCGLLRATPDGRQRVTGPALPGEHAAHLRSAGEGAMAYLPVDPTQTLLNRPAGQAQTIRTWLAAGGVFLVPILVVGALGVILILERMAYLFRTKPAPAMVAEVLSALDRGVAAAREKLTPARTPMARVLLAGVDTLDEPAAQRESAVESALLAEAPRLERSLSLLAALAGVAPLLGLLGTVSGMIATFHTISSAGTGNPRLLSGGISEALITTQLGLMVAIPLLLIHAWLSRWVQRREAMLEHAAAQLVGHAAPANGESGEADDA